MIRYSCRHCGEVLESPHSMVWQVEECYNCKTPNWVPKVGEDELAGPQPQFTPQCPHCKGQLPDTTPPTANYVDECPHCKGEIHIVPSQYLFPSMYLTEEQAGFVDFLEKLNYWPFGRGSYQDYEAAKAALAVKRGSEPPIRDVVVALIELSANACLHREKMGAQKVVLKGKEVPRLMDGSDPKHQRDELMNLMAELKKFEKDMKDASRQRSKVGT